MAESAPPAPPALTLEEKKAQARARAKAARAAQEAGDAFATVSPAAAAYIKRKAAELGIALSTVRTHLKRLYAKSATASTRATRPRASRRR